MFCALCTACSSQAMFEYFGREIDMMHKRMEVVFEETSQRTRATKVEAPDYNLTVDETDTSVLIRVTLDTSATTDDVSVALEDGLLEVVVAGRDTIEMKLNDQRLTFSAKQSLEHEQKDANGTLVTVSSGFANMMLTEVLPARVDLSKQPEADLTNHVLTITLAKKMPKKIVVTTSDQHEIVQNITDDNDIENLK